MGKVKARRSRAQFPLREGRWRRLARSASSRHPMVALKEVGPIYLDLCC